MCMSVYADALFRPAFAMEGEESESTPLLVPSTDSDSGTAKVPEELDNDETFFNRVVTPIATRVRKSTHTHTLT